MAKQKDDYGFAFLLDRSKKAEQELIDNCTRWVGEADKKFSGRWITDKSGDVYYLVENVVAVKYGLAGIDPLSVRYHPPHSMKTMLYSVRVKAYISMATDNAVIHESPANVLIHAMNGEWHVTTRKKVFSAALDVMCRVNKAISHLCDKNDTLETILGMVHD